MRAFILLFTALLSDIAYAGNIHSVCKNDYANCIKQLPDALSETREKSLNWFRFKHYEMKALFYLQKHSELRDLLDELGQISKIPLFVELQMDVLNAKSYFLTNPDLSLYHQEKAKNTFEDLLQTGGNPTLLIDYANLHLYLQQFDKGIHLLQRLQDRFANHNNPEVTSSIAINLGNFYMKKSWFEKARTQYQIAMRSSIDTTLVNSQIVSHYNYARTFQALSQYQEAVKPFQVAQEQAKSGGNKQIYSLCDLRLAQVYVQLEQWSKAKQHIDKITKSQFSLNIQPQANELLELITKELERNPS